LCEVDKSRVALWGDVDSPQEISAPDDTLKSLAEFIIGMLGSEPTRSQLSQASGKNRRRVSTVLSILKGLRLAEDQSDNCHLKLNKEQLLVFSDVKKFTHMYNSLREKRKKLIEVYHNLHKAMLDAPSTSVNDILVPDFANFTYPESGCFSSCFLQQPREWDCED